MKVQNLSIIKKMIIYQAYLKIRIIKIIKKYKKILIKTTQAINNIIYKII